MQNGYATVLPSNLPPNGYELKVFLAKAVAYHLLPGLLIGVVSGTVFFLLWWLVKGRRA